MLHRSFHQLRRHRGPSRLRGSLLGVSAVLLSLASLGGGCPTDLGGAEQEIRGTPGAKGDPGPKGDTGPAGLQGPEGF